MTMSTERSLRLTWVLPRPSLAGGVRTVRELGEAMTRRGHECVVVHPPLDHSWPPPWRVRSTFQHARARLEQRRRAPHHLVDTSLPVTVTSGDVVTEHDVPDADFVIATWWKTREWIDGLSARKGRPAYYVQHLETHSGDPSRVGRTYRAPAAKFAVATWLERRLREDYGDDDVAVVPNGYDRSWFHSRPREKPPIPTFGVMFSTRPWKGTEIAFEALRLASRSVPNLRVVSFGDEPLETARRPPRLRYQRAPHQSRIADAYRGCTAWIVPSFTEGFGLPGLEAAACSCPVIATRSGGPEDYVEDGRNGYLVEPGDVAAMAERIVAIAREREDGWKRMSEASRRIAGRFDWDRSAELLERHLLARCVEHLRGVA